MNEKLDAMSCLVCETWDRKLLGLNLDMSLSWDNKEEKVEVWGRGC